MMGDGPIIRDAGFQAEDWQGPFLTITAFAEALGDAPGRKLGLGLDPGDDLRALAPHLDRIGLIRIGFGSCADGRGFSVARRLRAMGYGGRLRAAGPILADQYAMARRAGFDEVAPTPEIAARQPEAQWRARADWQSGDYLARLRG